MQRKNTKKALKVLVSLVVAFAMIGIPASIFVPTTAAAPNDGDDDGRYPYHFDRMPSDDEKTTATADPYANIELLNENFDGTLPTTWTIMSGYPTAPYGSPDSIVWENTSLTTWTDIFEYNYSAPNSMFLNASDSDSLITPTINASGITGNMTLTFYSTIWQTGSVDIGIYDGAGTLIDTVTVSDRRTWNMYTVDLPGYEGSLFELAFHVTGETETVFIDDVVVTGSNRPDYDIAVEGFTELNCGGRMNTLPKELEVEVANWGTQDAGTVPFHFQIYQEKPLDLDTYKMWDMEECILNTWETHSYDGDQTTWYWTEQRANSPTHSYHSQPDNVATYEAYSNDSLILQDWFHVNETVDGEQVSTAYLTLSHWCEGEFDGTNAVDYGTIYVINETGARHKIAGPIYSTDGEWETLEGEDGYDISDYIGQDIKIEFNWQSDATNNYEGWYIDDVNIDYSYQANQPLVWDGYKNVDLPAETNKTITSQFDWEPETEGTYFIQVYVADYHIDDYDMTNNEINCTLWIGDVCDAATLDTTVSEDILLDHETGYVEVPINVTAYNNGTLTKDVPVQASAAHLIRETIFKDDMESGDQGWEFMWTGTGPAEDLWTITDTAFYGASPYNSWSLTETGTPLGHAKIWQPIDPFVEGGIQWQSKLKYNFGPGTSAVPVFLASSYYWDLSVYIDDSNYRVNPFDGSTSWTEFDADEFIKSNTLYWEQNPLWGGFGELDSLAELFENLQARYGGVEDFSQVQFGFLVESPSGMSSGEGFYFDNFELFHEYRGETVWTSETKTIEDMEPGETDHVEFTWNTTEYCDYIITGETTLDCDMDPTNDETTDTTRIHEWQYEDETESVSYDDNTCGGDTQWKIVEECSICPDDKFWWNGEEANYSADRDDVLEVGETLNFTGVSEAYLNFSHYYYLEDDYDYGYVEVSNDSGDTWFILDEITGDSGATWIDESYHLRPDWTELYSPYTETGFLMTNSFFTENMHFRFRFTSDPAIMEKGWYIDDVNVDMFNGSWNNVFFDDMESGADNWDTYYKCYGVHWHNTSAFGDGPTDEWWYNGEERLWENPGYIPVNATYSVDPMPSYWSYDNLNPGAGIVFNESYGFDFINWMAGAEAYFNQTGIQLPTGPVALKYVTWGLGGGGEEDPEDTPWYHWVEVTNGVDTEYFNVTVPGYQDTLITLDLTQFAGDTVDISLHHNGTCKNDFYGWFSMGGTPVDYYQPWYGSFEVWGYNESTPVETVPYHEYYNNVDEKIIFEYDLTHAYEGILHWDQNFSMANYPEDYGVVEIWTGSAWKALYIVQGDSAGTWAHSSLDISDYVGGDENTKIRFRFISNSTGADYGWLIDNVSIDGKVDYTAPAATHSLDPATPDGQNGWYTSDVTFTLSATDNTKVDHIEYRINGGNWLTYTGPVTIDDDGEFTIDYRPVDQVGNVGTTQTFSFKIDSTVPSGSIDTPQTGYIYLFGNELMPRILFKDKALIIGGLTATATATDDLSGMQYVTFETGKGSLNVVEPYEYNLPFYFPFGSDTLTATAVDNAGNTASIGSVDYLKIL